MNTYISRSLLVVSVAVLALLLVSNIAIADSPEDSPYPHPVLDPNFEREWGLPYPELNPDGTNANTLPRDTRFDHLLLKASSIASGIIPQCIPTETGCWTPSLCDDISDVGHQQNNYTCTRTTYYLCDAQHQSCNNPNACGINPFTTQDIVAVNTSQYPRCSGTFSVLSSGGGLWGYFPNGDVDGTPIWNWVDILNHNIGDVNWLKLL